MKNHVPTCCIGVKAWLDPLRTALESASGPVVCFFRDDDAGWRADRLRALLTLFAELGLPLDLAVIPAALERGEASELGDLPSERTAESETDQASDELAARRKARLTG